MKRPVSREGAKAEKVKIKAAAKASSKTRGKIERASHETRSAKRDSASRAMSAESKPQLKSTSNPAESARDLKDDSPGAPEAKDPFDPEDFNRGSTPRRRSGD